MLNQKVYRVIILVICISIVLALCKNPTALADVTNYISKSLIANDLKPITETKDKLEDLSLEGKNVLENLFILSQEILEMEKEEKRISAEITNIDLESKDLEEQIIISQTNYDKQLDILQQVLVGYQKRGPVSYVETLLNAGDLKTFVRSLNIIREFSKNTASLLDSLEKQKDELTENRTNLANTLVLLEEKREELKGPLVKKIKLKEEQETYLQSLGDQKALYSEYLIDMEEKWNENKSLFKILIEDFSKIVDESNIDIEDLNIAFSFLGVTGALYEDTFNGLFEMHDTLSSMKFTFSNDSIEIDIPDLHLRLFGTFILEEGSILKFSVLEGSFYDMPLETSSIVELFEEGDFVINVKELVKDMVTIDFTIDAISINDGYLEFKLTAKFF